MGTAFTPAAARELGIADGRLRGRDLRHPFHGVVTDRVDTTHTLGRCFAYEPALLDGQFFSHVTAAQVFGFALPEIGDPSLHVAVFSPRTPPARPGVVGHALNHETTAVTIHQGLPLISVADTWCHLATSLSRQDLVAAGDSLLSKRDRGGVRLPHLATIGDLQAAAGRHRGERGAVAIRWALQRLRSGPDSRPESLLRLLLIEAGLPEPLIGDPTPVENGVILHPDLKYPKWKVVFEYEGDDHRTNRRRWKDDIERRELLETAGWRVIRVSSDDLFVRPDLFIARVRRILREREPR